jgi:hypothetical protein
VQESQQRSPLCLFSVRPKRERLHCLRSRLEMANGHTKLCVLGIAALGHELCRDAWRRRAGVFHAWNCPSRMMRGFAASVSSRVESKRESGERPGRRGQLGASNPRLCRSVRTLLIATSTRRFRVPALRHTPCPFLRRNHIQFRADSGDQVTGFWLPPRGALRKARP